MNGTKKRENSLNRISRKNSRCFLLGCVAFVGFILGLVLLGVGVILGYAGADVLLSAGVVLVGGACMLCGIFFSLLSECSE